MEVAHTPTVFLQGIWCPQCGKRSSPKGCADPFAVCFACAMDHRFYIPAAYAVSSQTEKASSLSVPAVAGASDAEIAQYWLTNPYARGHLNSQLVELLRQFVEHRALSYEPRFNWCPACGKSLSPFDQPDVWVQGLACENGHEFMERGGYISGSLGGEHISLLAEYPATAMKAVIGGWLKPNSIFAHQMHPTVRNILEHFASGQLATV